MVNANQRLLVCMHSYKIYVEGMAYRPAAAEPRKRPLRVVEPGTPFRAEGCISPNKTPTNLAFLFAFKALSIYPYTVA
jgi:hypothetical protein